MQRVISAAVIIFICSLGGEIQAETQTFDTEATASAAGWTESGSRINNFDFGFSATNNAEGTAAGEGGGRIARSEPLGYYGDLTVGGTSDLNVDLNASGRLKFQDSAYDGEFFFGYFDKAAAEGNNNSYLGIHVREPRDGVWRVDSSINGNDGDRLNIPDDTAFNFVFDWDADGGAAPGNGMLTLTLSTLDGAQSFVSSIEGFDGINVDAFGLLNRPQGGNPGQVGSFWFDNLEYSAVPEPSSIVLAICGLLGLAITAWRRRTRE